MFLCINTAVWMQYTAHDVQILTIALYVQRKWE